MHLNELLGVVVNSAKSNIVNAKRKVISQITTRNGKKSKQNQFELLPDDLFLVILEYLQWGEISRCSLVSTKWNSIIWKSRKYFWTNQNITPNVALFLSTKCSQLERIYQTTFSDESCSNIALFRLSQLPKLQFLRLSCWALSETAFPYLENLSSTLKVLFLLKCFQSVSDSALLHIGNLFQLRTLGFSNLQNVTVAGIQQPSRLADLQCLQFWNCPALKDDCLAAISKFTQLRVLEFQQCDNLTNVGLENLTSLTNLSKLSISYGKGFTSEGISKVKRKLRL